MDLDYSVEEWDYILMTRDAIRAIAIDVQVTLTTGSHLYRKAIPILQRLDTYMDNLEAALNPE